MTTLGRFSTDLIILNDGITSWLNTFKNVDVQPALLRTKRRDPRVESLRSLVSLPSVAATVAPQVTITIQRMVIKYVTIVDPAPI